MPLILIDVFAQTCDRNGAFHTASIPIQAKCIACIVIDPWKPLRFREIGFKRRNWEDIVRTDVDGRRMDWTKPNGLIRYSYDLHLLYSASRLRIDG